MGFADDKGVVTFEVHHEGSLVWSEQKKWTYVGGYWILELGCVEEYMSMLEMWEMTDMLGYNDTVYGFGIKNGEVVDINTYNKLMVCYGATQLCKSGGGVHGTI